MSGGQLQRVKVGELTATLLPVGEISDDVGDWFPADADLAPKGVSRLPVNCLHIGGPGISVLVDACDPGLYPRTGQPVEPLGDALEGAGIHPEHVTHVILTHGHHDHFCGVAGPDGKPCFPAARHILSGGDWANGTLTADAQMADGRAADPTALEMLFKRGLLDIGQSAVPLPSQITLTDAPGETAGHRVVRLSSGGVVLYFLADLFHLQAEIKDPTLCPLWADKTTLMESRRRLISAICRDGARFLCSHTAEIFSADIFTRYAPLTREASK